MSTLAASVPTCSTCGFDPVEINRPYAKDKLLCDVCCNKELQITWHVGSKVFHSRREADAWRVLYKRVKPAVPKMVMPEHTPVRPPIAVKRPIDVRDGKVIKQPCEWISRKEICVIDLTKDFEEAKTPDADIVDIDIFDNDDWVGLSDTDSDDNHN